MKRRLFKILKIVGATVAGLLILLFLIPVLFPGKVVEKVKTWTNKSIDGELNFSKVRLSFFNHFPSLTVTLYGVSLKGSAPFRKDTLVAADEIALGIDIKSLLIDGRINIDEIYLSKALINILVNKKGEANYNVYTPAKEKETKIPDSSQTALRLEKVDIENCTFRYDDKSVGLLLNARGFNYTGNGELSEDVFDLNSYAHIGSLDFYFDNEPYLMNKKVDAELVTRVNTNSLAFIFEKNQLKVNKLPVEFTGKLNFLKNGYKMDFTVSSTQSDLSDLFTAFPRQYLEWQKKAKVNGTMDLLLKFNGEYIASQNKMPSLDFAMKVKNGFVQYDNAPFPASNLFVDFQTKIPSLNTDSMEVKIDSLFFNVGKDYLGAAILLRGLSRPYINARMNANLDLAEADRAFGLKSFDLKGKLVSKLDVNGIYDPAKKSLPVIHANVAVDDGNIKTAYYPNAITNIQVKADIQNPSGTMKDMQVNIKPFSFEFEGKPFVAAVALTNFENIIYDIKAKGEIDVAKVYKVFAIDDLKLNGFIDADLSLQGTQADAVNGNYNKLNNRGTLRLRDIKTTSKYFPLDFIIKQGLFKFNQDKVLFEDFKGDYGHSDFTMNGYLQNVVDYVFSSNGILSGRFGVRSGYINVNEFGSFNSATTPVQKASEEEVIQIPSQYNLSLVASANKVVFDSLVLDSLTGAISISNGTLLLEKAGFGIIGCKTVIDLSYAPISHQRASFDYHIVAKNFDVKKAYDSVKIFRELASAAGKSQGIVSIDYKLKGVLDQNMQPIYPSLEGGGVLSVQDVKVSGLKLFSDVARRIKNDSISNPNLRKINIKSSIKNNVITVERFKFKVFGFRPRIDGKTNFDGQLDLRMRLGLPPLGIIGIPIRVSGTQDEPIIKLGRRNKEVEETIYAEEENKN